MCVFPMKPVLYVCNVDEASVKNGNKYVDDVKRVIRDEEIIVIATAIEAEISELENLRWPWSDSDGSGMERLLLAYALFLIPSALWLESTSYHLSNDYSWTPIIVVGTLLITSIGNIMLGLIAYSAYVDGIQGSQMMLLGAFLISIQCILNDLIIWSVKFPW